MLRRIVPLIVVVAVALAVPGWTLACTCAVLPPQQAFARSTAVFAGTVTGIEGPAEGSVVSSADPVRVRFSVWRVWKGPRQRALVVSTARMSISCGYPFTTGGVYLVYAYDRDGALETNLCTRTRPLALAAEDLLALGEWKGLLVAMALVAGAALAIGLLSRRRARSRRG